MTRAKAVGDAGRRSSIDPEEFVRVWTRAASADDVAAHFGITRQWAYQFARSLRDHGVHLKAFKRGRRVDVTRLNRIIDEESK